MKIPVRKNPRANRDCVIELKTHFALPPNPETAGSGLAIRIRYVPDRLIADLQKIKSYYNSLAAHSLDGIEEMANAIVDDFSNELIPRWVGVDVTMTRESDSASGSVHVEDKQPLWENSALLQRLN